MAALTAQLRIRSIFLVFCLIVVPAGVAAEPTVERVRVPMVQVPVNVLLDGEPLTGLSVENFEIYDRRKRQEISAFDVIDLSLLQSPTVDESRPALEIAGVRHFMLVFDLSFSDASSLGRARAAVLAWVGAALHPSDLVAVTTYSVDHGPKLLLNFTPDRGQVVTALGLLDRPLNDERVRDPLKLALHEANLDRFEKAEYSSMLDGSRRLNEDDLIEESLGAIFHGAYDRLTDQRQRHQISAMTRSFAQLAQLTASVSGRKYLIYLSEGFDSSLVFASDDRTDIDSMNASIENGGIWRVDSSKRFGNSGAQSELLDMLAEFRKVDCVIEAVDINALGGDGNKTLPGSADSLFMLANETGGEMHRNFRNLSAAMDRMLKKTSVTYVLSYRPTQLKSDGKYHKLKVKLSGAPKRADLHHRPGYYAPKPEGERSPIDSMMRTGEMIVRGGNDGLLPVSVLATPFPRETAGAYVPVLIETEGRTLLAGQSGDRMSVEIFAYALDPSNAILDFFNQTINVALDGTRQGIERGGLKYFGELDLPPGSYSLRVLVRNVDTRVYGMRTEQIEVPRFDEEQAVVLTPHSPEARGKWLLVRDERDAENRPPFPFMLGTEPYLPAAHAELSQADGTDLILLGYNLGPELPTLRGRVLDRNGNEVASMKLDLLGRSSTVVNGAERLLTRFRPDGLAAGEYRLNVSIDDVAGRRRAAEMPFRIRRLEERPAPRGETCLLPFRRSRKFRILSVSMIDRTHSAARSVRWLLPGVLLLLATLPDCGGPPSAEVDVDPRLARVMSMLDERSAERFEAGIENDAQTGVGELHELAGVATTAPPDALSAIADYLARAARSRGRRLSARGAPWSDEDLAGWLALVFLDPVRFASDVEFRGFVLGVVVEALDPGVSADLRDALLGRVHRVEGMEFPDAERIELAWGVARRSSVEREAAYSVADGRVVDDLAGAIEASIYSFPSGLIDAATATRFLEEVGRVAPDRALVVLSDPALAGELEREAGAVDLHVIRNHGTPYSPWPRDPFSFLRRTDGGVLLLLRPNVQHLREADNVMGLELIQGLPDALDEAWGRPTWQRSPVPFHNGQLLTVGDAIWLSAHSLEPRILELIGEQAVPVAELGTDAGWKRYAAAADQAATELGVLYGRQPFFVHSMEQADASFLESLGGGAGFDLDSLVTPLLSPRGKVHALIGDIGEGARLLEEVPAEQLDELGESHRLGSGGDVLRRRLLEFQRDEPAQGLGRFVDRVAAHLDRSGLAVERLPLLLLPAESAPRPEAPLARPFLISWNNVVQEDRNGRRHAEGFSGGLRSGDRRARRKFSRMGYQLELLPPLVESVVRNGGYRCASQHLRR